MDYSISLNGIHSAQWRLEQAARRISTPEPATDYAAEFVAVDQAKIAAKANLKVLSIEADLDTAILDIFA